MNKYSHMQSMIVGRPRAAAAHLRAPACPPDPRTACEEEMAAGPGTATAAAGSQRPQTHVGSTPRTSRDAVLPCNVLPRASVVEGGHLSRLEIRGRNFQLNWNDSSQFVAGRSILWPSALGFDLLLWCMVGGLLKGHHRPPASSRRTHGQLAKKRWPRRDQAPPRPPLLPAASGPTPTPSTSRAAVLLPRTPTTPSSSSWTRASSAAAAPPSTCVAAAC